MMFARTARALAKACGPAARSDAPRAFGALSSTDDSFLKWTSPVPAIHEHLPILGGNPSETSTLPNGLRVVTESIPHSSTATVGVWIDAGSRFETAATNGTAHFLEHMAFKGTKTRSAKQLEEEVENMGGHLNAYTSREQTTYYAKVFKEDVGKAMDILSDILQNSNLDEKSVERERDVILREMQEVEGVPEEVLFDHLHATAFQHSPLGRTILGPADNVRSITKADLADYIATHYTAPRMVVSAAGAVDHKQVADLAGKAFGSLPTDPTTGSDQAAADPAFFTGSEVRIRDDDMAACHFAIAFEGASWADADSVPLMVMQTMLGTWDKSAGAASNMGSKLAQRLSSDNLCNSFMAFNTNYCDSGLFGVYAVADPAHLDDTAWCIMYELSKMSYECDEEDVARARNQLKSSLMLSLDNTSSAAELNGRQMLTYGRRMPMAEMFARIDAVDANAITSVADRFIFDKDIAVAAMGPTQFLPDYNWLRRRTYMNRY